jgi:pimeloyl-ACP methyl ester carboxylesterase
MADHGNVRVHLTTGVTLDVVLCGPADGEPVLFLHGFTDSWFSFSRVLELLPSGVRAIVPTQRGHGKSGKPDAGYQVADFAADAVALLDTLRVDRATVVGHSMGSFIAQRLAAEHPSRVTRLVLVGSGTTARMPPVIELAGAVKDLKDPVGVDFIRDFQMSTIHRAVPDAFLERVIRESTKVPAHVWRDVLAGLISNEGQTELDRITAPTLVVWGDQDAFWPREAQDGLARAIRDARLVVFGGTGHAPHWEEPERFVSVV